MKSPREPKVHYGRSMTGCGPTLRPWVVSPRETDLVVNVTCRRCVYQLWRKGKIEDSDSRITESMRTYARNAFIMLARRAHVREK